MICAYNHNTYIAINYSTSQVSQTHVRVMWIYLTDAMHCALGNTVIGANMVLPQSHGNTVFRISSAVMIKWPMSYCWYSNIPKCNWISKCLYGFNSIFKYHCEQIFRMILLQKLALINSLKYWSCTYRRQKPYHHSSCRCPPPTFYHASALRRRRHYVFGLSSRPAEAWNTLFWPVHGSVGPTD